jgi:hypothetical protein
MFHDAAIAFGSGALFSLLILYKMNIIFIIHVIFLGWILVTPFLNDRRQLEFYSMVIPFIFYHWSVNDDTCALTQAEMMVTGKNKDETFMGRVVGPIYKMEENDINKLTKTVFFALWALVGYRLGHFNMFAEDLRKILKRRA